MKILNIHFKMKMESLPCYTSIKNWCEKSGCHVYEQDLKTEYPDGYAVILDESMMVGSEKMVLSLGVPAGKTGETAVTGGDVKVLNISVKSSWNGQDIAEVLDTVETKTGKAASYVISDNAASISKGVRLKNRVHIRDAGHSIAMFFKQVYEKDDEFESWMKSLSNVRFREIMRPAAYLLPPKQRTTSRFLNIDALVTRSVKMLKVINKLNKEEKKIFRFLKKHAGIISELNELINCTRIILKTLKNSGLSQKTAELCLDRIKPLKSSSFKRVVRVANELENYILVELGKLADKNIPCHISSDIVESLFGKFKMIKSPNKMNGVTTRIFFLPLFTAVNDTENCICYKTCLEKVFLKDLAQWKQDNLSDNMTVKRIKTFAGF